MSTPLPTIAQSEFTQLVNSALKNYQSTLALARSPLADSALVTPLLVLDDVSPTADERGHALRLILQWAVARLAPAPVAYPLGVFRPYDDPTWRDPLWWRYNILRHRYLEPLHPDDFLEGGRFTETLVALTGIPSSDTFFDERNRAIREVVQRLQQQLTEGTATAELQQLALEEMMRPLRTQPHAHALLGVAASFDDVFPRAWLLQMAEREQLVNVSQSLDYLTTQRYLLAGDGAQSLWLSPRLRPYIYARENSAKMRRRQLWVADHYIADQDPLSAAHHLQQAEEWERAAQLLLAHAEDLINELQVEELHEALSHFRHEQLADARWYAIQLLISDLERRRGKHEAALAACRRALRAASSSQQQAQVYWRMGKLYEKRNQLHALGYYQQAVDNFDQQDAGLVELLKDRAWIYLFRCEWAKAEQDLTLALHLAPAAAEEARADILDALAHLHLEQNHYAPAIGYARQSLLLREAAGDLVQVAKSLNNLGNFYNRMGEATQAIAAHDEAIRLCERLNNQEILAETLLNQGVVYHLAGELQAAVGNYQKSLAISQANGLLLAEVKAHSNLAEALAQLNQSTYAQRHWQLGYELSCEAGFQDQISYFQALQTQLPALHATTDVAANAMAAPLTLAPPALTHDERAALEIVERTGQVTPKLLMEHAHISKATATRRLADLVASGFLQKQGKGRGTYYTLKALAGPLRKEARATDAMHAAQATDPATGAQLRAQLQPHTHQLVEQYALTALAVIPTAGAAAGPPTAPLRLVALFQQPPSLLQFFVLEEQLCTLLGREIDLTPLELWQAKVGVFTTELLWLIGKP
ncbi:MAG: tetratricopeptide repeat protein [Caldilineaceae bacterium]